MSNRKDIYRKAWSADGRYLIRAHSRSSVDTAIKSSNKTVGVMQVFEGDPKISDMSEIFGSPSKLNDIDLLDELQNAEWLGRDFIANIKR